MLHHLTVYGSTPELASDFASRATDTESRMTPSNPRQLRVISHFQLLRELGGGEKSVVYLAADRNLPRDVVLKVMRPAIARDAGRRRGFLHEAHKVATLNHPNIVKVWGVGEDHGLPFISYQLIKGESLERRLRRVGKLSLDNSLTLLRQLAAAVDHTHSQGICHGDIKPANILIDNSGNLVLVDFGLASRGDDGGTLGGTAEYMARELFNGSPQHTSSDVYALGVTAYRMLTGTTPFNGDTLRLAYAHGHVEVPRAEGMSDCVLRAIRRAMAKNPKERWPRATDFVDALQNCRREPPLLGPVVVAVGVVGLFLLLSRSCTTPPVPDGAPSTIAHPSPTGMATDIPFGEVNQVVPTDENDRRTAATDTPAPSPTVQPTAPLRPTRVATSEVGSPVGSSPMDNADATETKRSELKERRTVPPPPVVPTEVPPTVEPSPQAAQITEPPPTQPLPPPQRQ